jgi:nucleotide-binding universal stress UspA family protein
MQDYPRILFPLDFSPAAPAVAQHVSLVAGKFKSELHVMHVIPGYEHQSFPSYTQVIQEIKAQAISALETFTAKHFAGFKVQAEVLSGHTGRRILDYAENNDISLIIMGTHGRSDFSKLIFGSVAQRVVQSAAIPVMTINPAKAMEAATESET